jgi:hypothetical protein
MSSTHYTVSGRGPAVIINFSTLVALTTVAIALRVYVRGWMVKSFRIDDWTALCGWVTYIGLASTAMAATHHGFGQHAYLITPRSEIEIALKVRHILPLVHFSANHV